MTLFVGLGNIGKEYEESRHNIGFDAIDVILQEKDYSDISKPTFYGKLYKDRDFLYLKPSTFMNNSGKSVLAVAHFFKIEIENIVVIHDDLDLPFGSLRFKVGGGDGGHNGLKSIDSIVGKEYKRCRIGIGKPARKSEVTGYVLGNFTPSEQKDMQTLLKYLKDSLIFIDKMSLSEFQSKYTLKSIEDIK